MANKKVYYNEDNPTADLQIFKSADGGLFVSLDDNHGGALSVSLTEEDALELISDLIKDFDLLDSEEYMDGRWTLKPILNL